MVRPGKAARTRKGRCMEYPYYCAGEWLREGEALDVSPAAEGRIGLGRYVPAGPVLAITPFNFPLNLVAHKLAPAFAAGCPVILKPSSEAPLTALMLACSPYPVGAPRRSRGVPRSKR